MFHHIAQRHEIELFAPVCWRLAIRNVVDLKFGINAESVENDFSAIECFLSNIDAERLCCSLIGKRRKHASLTAADLANVLAFERYASRFEIRHKLLDSEAILIAEIILIVRADKARELLHSRMLCGGIAHGFFAM